MNRWLKFLFILLFAARAFGADASKSNQPKEFLIEPVPDWTTSSIIEDRNNPLEKQATAGVFILLFNVEVNGGTHEKFIHVAQKFLSSAGVEANSRLSFVFDPSYQQLVIHKIVIHRGDQVLNQLESDRIRVIQQEKELDRLIYNGAKTALLFLEDVRVGDWVEYAYTVRGRNPIEAGHFFDALQLAYPFPIQSENYRFLWPRTNSPLWVQIAGDAPQNRKTTEHFYEYAWHWENRRGEEIEDFLPVFTLPYTIAHFSDYRTWTDVARWAQNSFRPEKVSEELHQKIMQIREENATDEQRVLKALQFVQDEIRYLGIENGINSHQPTDPSVVFARRYGDCKDKALLFCTMLSFFKPVDAAPVLVSTRFRAAVKSFIATPLIFDHAIVRIILNGKTNFVDVTRSFQRGTLEQRFVDDFGGGVLLDENAPGLIMIPPTNAGMPKTRIEEKFDVSTSGATELWVNSTYEGRDADFMRQYLALVSQDSIEKNTLAFYKKFYESIASADRPKLHDDEQSNQIQIVRHFFIPNIWKASTRTNFITCEFVSHGIFDRLYIPSKKERKKPLAVLFPDNYIHTIRIKTHEPWQVLPRDKTIRTKSFLFHNRNTCTNDEYTVTCQILPLNQFVLPEDMTEYWAALNEVPQFLGLAITKPLVGVGQSDAPNWSLWIAGVFYCVVLLIVVVVVYRYQPKSPPEIILSENQNLKGLGGWLILLGIALMTAPFVRVLSLVRSGAAYSTMNWRVITDSTSVGYDPMLAPILLYELFLQLTLLIFSLLLIVLFFRKKRIFRPVLIAYLSIQFVGFTLDEALAASRSNAMVTTMTPRRATSETARTLVPLVLWGLYVTRSKRVKMTFLN